jgi:5-formyltetrahydrofolate cyclo-ligase
VISKAALRKDIKSRLRTLPAGSVRIEGASAAVCIREQPCWKNSKTILLFLSMKDEIDTRPLIEAAFQDKKAVFAPKIEGENLRFYRLCALPDDSGETGPFGIRTPPSGTGEGARDLKGAAFGARDFPALIIVPGLAFDTQGRRLGRGRGYYDRFLAEFDAGSGEHQNTETPPRCTALGLCLESQLVDQVPVDTWDKAMDYVCAGNKIRRPGSPPPEGCRRSHGHIPGAEDLFFAQRFNTLREQQPRR